MRPADVPKCRGMLPLHRPRIKLPFIDHGSSCLSDAMRSPATGRSKLTRDMCISRSNGPCDTSADPDGAGIPPKKCPAKTSVALSARCACCPFRPLSSAMQFIVDSTGLIRVDCVAQNWLREQGTCLTSVPARPVSRGPRSLALPSQIWRFRLHERSIMGSALPNLRLVNVIKEMM